jgi:hypothetical protein
VSEILEEPAVCIFKEAVLPQKIEASRFLQNTGDHLSKYRTLSERY